MASDRLFARVYYVDLERDYPQVWRDNALLSTYIRLLSVAEAMWPAVPEVPRSARLACVKALVSTSLVEMVPPLAFRIKGMDAERNARSNAASNAARSRWSNAPAHADAMPSQTKPIQPSHRAPAREGPKDPLREDQRAAYIELYGNGVDDPIGAQPMTFLTADGAEREALRLEALALHERYKRGELSPSEYERLRADLGKQPDDLTRAGA